MPQTVTGQRGAGGIGGPPSGRLSSTRRWGLQSAAVGSNVQPKHLEESAGSENPPLDYGRTTPPARVNSTGKLSGQAPPAPLAGQKNPILAAATHDLRSPISAIILFAELLQDEGASQLSANQRELISGIRSSSELALKLVDDLLDASVIQVGGFQLCLEDVDIATIANECLSMQRAAACKKNAHLTFRRHANLPAIKADRLKILRVINELLSNAIRVSCAGGKIEIELTARGRFLEITVQDEGPGIPPESLKTLFTAFPKEARSRRAGERGLGLGLAIVKGIVSAHKGRIRVRSQVGIGSTFVVSLPLHRG